ncbi:hypothetical protein PACTADRAFT_35523 [Pachysolen tannophilus NRRL Y-2460]|uniref:Non-structural maintenance of chromosomes element 4 n=1 Tax=Pachysolen tannophilus NRRL Y-2460 TaxID=669874 RepID=A0A1E4TPU3_PACTA|nr:hypothetical protein PACTADRAFT_35523 [Pachysolen tannophilus NRRL Y-2460]
MNSVKRRSSEEDGNQDIKRYKSNGVHISENEDNEEEEEEEEDDDDDDDEEEEEDSEDEEDHEGITMTQKQFDNFIGKTIEGYRQLSDNLVSERAQVAREGGVRIVTESLLKVNSLYENTKKINDSSINEISNLDSKAFKEIGSQAKIGITNLRLGATEKGLDFDDFLKKFALYAKKNNSQREEFEAVNEDDNDDEDYDRNGGGGGLFYQGDINRSADADAAFSTFNWGKLSSLYFKHSFQAPTIDFLLGPLEIEQKPRRQVVRERDYLKTGQAVKPTQIAASDFKHDTDKDTYSASIKCFDIIKKKQSGRKMNLFKFFINPKSFSQSIENLFYTSFLINNNRLILDKDKNGIPTIQEVTKENVAELPQYFSKNGNAASSKTIEKTHLIFRMEYDTWQKLIETYNITESFLGDRSERDHSDE